MTSFDERAADWDDDPKKRERAAVFADHIRNFLEGRNLSDAFEFGCGTGLLSYFLREQFERITLADSSAGMLKVLKNRIKENHLDHFRPLKIDLEKRGLNEKFDIIYTLMTLHHIRDLDILFHRFNSLLVEGGILCIGDLEKEDGSFHAHMPDFDGHNGFEQEQLRSAPLASRVHDPGLYRFLLDRKRFRTREEKLPSLPADSTKAGNQVLMLII